MPPRKKRKSVKYWRHVAPENASKLVYALAFDPGETTGWCVMGVHPSALDMRYKDEGNILPLHQRIIHCEYGEIDCITSGGFNDQMNKHAGIAFGAEALGVGTMLGLYLRYQDPAIVVEDFVPDMTKMDQARHTLSPVRIMSMLSYAMYIEHETTLDSRVFIQNRSMPKTTCTDDRLENWGLYDTHSGRHARDATRHALYFLRTCRGNEAKAAENRFKAWPQKFKDPWAENSDQFTRKTSKKKEPERVYFA